MKIPESTNAEDIRWRQRLQKFTKAYGRLAAAVELARARPLSELEQQGLIQAFEFTHELAWNTLKDYLKAHGNTTSMYGAKDVTREAFAAGLIDNGKVWMEMVGSRNLSSHTYNEEVAAAIAESVIMHYVAEFDKLMNALLKLKS